MKLRRVVVLGTDDEKGPSKVDGTKRSGDKRGDAKGITDNNLRRKKILAIITIIVTLVALVIRIIVLFKQLHS